MEVVNTKRFEVVFTFVNHPFFGMLVEANAVQLLENGNPSLTFQRIRKQNADYFGLDDNQKKAVNIIENYEVDQIMKKYYTGTKKIRATDFFAKHFNEEIKKMVREYVENQLIKLLHIIKDYPLYRSGNLGEPMGYKLSFSNEPTTVLFHFRRDEEGINYFVTLRHRDEKVTIYQKDVELLVGKPAWLLTQDKLLFFQSHIDGNKIKPFFSKKHIHIEPKQEEVYLQKFVLPLLENHDVFAKGFSITTENLQVKPVLRISRVLEQEAQAILYFQYGSWLFPYHVDKRVNVRLGKEGNDYTFYRIKRSYNIEKEKIKTLKELGLEHGEGSIFKMPQNEENQNPYGIIEWLNEHRESLERDTFVIEQDFHDIKYFLGNIDLKVKVNQAEDWFDILAIVRFGDFEIPFKRLKSNILQNKREFLLPDGSVAIIPNEWFSRFSKVLNFSEETHEGLRIKKIHLSLLEDIQSFMEEELPSSDWVNTIANEGIPEYDIPSGFQAEFRSYQKQGYDWLRFILENGLGALLADDMGLGKTIQTLAIIQHIHNEFKKSKDYDRRPSKEQLLQWIQEPHHDDSLWIGPSVVVCPKSLLYNWKSETMKFAPNLKVCIYNGLGRQKLIADFSDIDLLVISYGTLRNDTELLRKFEFRLMVLDESQAIKNPSSLIARNLLKIPVKKRIALTGTPIENTLADVWSQMNFLNPGLLGSFTYFDKNFIKPIEKTGNERKALELKKFIDPFVLRRTKGQVMKDLPPKIEKIHYCEMNEEQEEIYERVKSQYRNEILSHVNQVGINKSRLKIFNGLMHLRQLALNPVLKENEYQGGSGKDEEITHMLLRAIDNGHKILLFSQFVGYLKNIGEILKENGIAYCYLDGSMDEKDRAEQIEIFQETSDIKVFLLSLRAGNSGLNLTAADYVFLADPWWNPFTMKQAEDRAHRIGQNRTVMSYKFITKNTIEEKILALQQRKTKLAESIIPDEDTLLNNIDIKELEELLS
jgi:SNF2 family DNA or RNA helicase